MPDDTSRTVFDAVIVGAGPAGSTAAIVLARAGRQVCVVDKATFPRDKCCGDGLTTLALRELEAIGLRPEHVPSWQIVSAAWLLDANATDPEKVRDLARRIEGFANADGRLAARVRQGGNRTPFTVDVNGKGVFHWRAHGRQRG